MVDIGVLGDAKRPNTFMEGWWNWWMNSQLMDGSDLGPLLKLHGKNGLLQIMASLL
jgi:hypothetical protein